MLSKQVEESLRASQEHLKNDPGLYYTMKIDGFRMRNSIRQP